MSAIFFSLTSFHFFSLSPSSLIVSFILSRFSSSSSSSTFFFFHAASCHRRRARGYARACVYF
jgi:hypothetical protein